MTYVDDSGYGQEQCPICNAVWLKGEKPRCKCLPQYTAGVSMLERAFLCDNPTLVSADPSETISQVIARVKRFAGNCPVRFNQEALVLADTASQSET